MSEVIAKSKQHKMMRQTQQEEDESLRHELDQEFDSIRAMLYAAPADQTPAAGTSADAPIPVPADPGPDATDKEYDQFVRELALDRRAKPKDRTKTEEELALEEKEALEKAERKRIRRMNGEESDSDEEGQGRRRHVRKRGGDDLDDDFAEAEEGPWDGLGGGLGDDEGLGGVAVVKMDEDEDDEDDEDDGEEEIGSDEDESEGEDRSVAEEFESASEEFGEEDGEDGEEEALVSSRQSQPAKRAVAPKELPYTFPCPETHSEFMEIVENIEDVDVPTVVKRIRTLHHPSLAADNKLKLQVRLSHHLRSQ